MPDLFTEPDEEPESLPSEPHNQRIRIASLAPESSANDLDYECVPLDNTVFQKTNRIVLPTAGNEGPEYLYPNEIATKPDESTILAVTGTTGLVHGTIFENPYYIKMNGSSKCQEMWPVRLDRDTSKPPTTQSCASRTRHNENHADYFLVSWTPLQMILVVLAMNDMAFILDIC